MKKVVIGLALAFAFALPPQHAPAQAAPAQQAAPKPPVSPSQSLLEVWNYVGQKLIAMAEDFPEEKYDFKPTPAQRSFAEQLLHAAGANYFFIDPAKGVKPPSGDPKRADYIFKPAGSRV